MVLNGYQFEVERVYKQTLGELTDDMAHQEEYGSVEVHFVDSSLNALVTTHDGLVSRT